MIDMIYQTFSDKFLLIKYDVIINAYIGRR